MNAALPTVDSMTSLFTPAILFCIVNLVIGTIFIASRLKSHNKPDPAANSPPIQNQLVRVPSLLDRVKSFNFSSYVFEQPDPFRAAAQKSDPREVQEQERKNVDVAEEEVFLESHHDDDQMMESKSETCVEAPAANVGPAGRMKKSASEKPVGVMEDREEVDLRRPATMRERKVETETLAFEEEEAVDKKADAFINRFRQHLKLQRLDSILRYKEMLNRGAGLES